MIVGLNCITNRKEQNKTNIIRWFLFDETKSVLHQKLHKFFFEENLKKNINFEFLEVQIIFVENIKDTPIIFVLTSGWHLLCYAFTILFY